MKRYAALLAAVLLLSACSVQAGSMPDPTFSSEPQASQLKVLDDSGRTVLPSQEIEPESIQEEDESEMLRKAAQLLDQYREQNTGNTMLSPLSLYGAIGLAANGAEGQTLAQIENYLGLSVSEVNRVFEQLRDDNVIQSANSIWYRNESNALKKGGLTPQKGFMEVAEGAYRGEAFACDFTSPDTVMEMNQWASQHTDGMIPEIVSELDPNTAMTLLNALLFQGLWITPYGDHAVQEAPFTLPDGSTVQAEMMSSTESVYLENQQATGFIKGYEDGYYFVAVLPKKTGSFTLEELSLDTLLSSEASGFEVYARLPKFAFSCGGSLNAILQGAGVTDAFQEEKADFSRLFQEDRPVWISDVVQKTRVELSESGTKAAAVTSVMFMTKAALIPPTMRREVVLDRPFAFLIMKEGLDIPLFAGIVENPKAD